MKALSLKQPWAELVLQGKKNIELRKWNTNFRGEFLIHASKIPDKKAMNEFGFTNLPLGMVTGQANLIGVKRYLDEAEFNQDKRLHLATKKFGQYGFILKDVKRIEPFPAKGNLNFWECKK